MGGFKQGLELCIKENKRRAVRKERRDGRREGRKEGRKGGRDGQRGGGRRNIDKEERIEVRKVKREREKAKNALLAPRGEETIIGSRFTYTDNVQYSIKQSAAAEGRVLSFSRLWIKT